MTARLILAALVAFAAPAAPAAAAPTMQPLKPCYVSAGEAADRREPMQIVGSGFTPNAAVDVLIDGAAVASGAADPLGELEASVSAPYQDAGERAFTLSVVERDNPANVASTPSRVTALGMTLRPRQARPSKRVRFRGRGFTGRGPVYAHYLYAGRVRKTVRLGRPRGTCGTIFARRRQIPLRRPRTGDWTVQVDQRRDWAADPGTNWVRLLIKVRRVFRNP
jgi:hypothetical protein